VDSGRRHFLNSQKENWLAQIEKNYSCFVLGKFPPATVGSPVCIGPNVRLVCSRECNEPFIAQPTSGKFKLLNV
jgi:hypothetical protein